MNGITILYKISFIGWRLKSPSISWTLISIKAEGYCGLWSTKSEETYSLIKCIPTDLEESAFLFWDQESYCWTNDTSDSDLFFCRRKRIQLPGTTSIPEHCIFRN